MTKKKQKALEVAYRLLTPQQRLTLIYKSMLAEQEHRTKDEPIELETPPFALINDDIKHIKVSSFIKVIVHNDYTDIILDGEPNEEQLSEALQSIMFQYHDTIMDEKTEIYKSTVNKIHALQIKMNRVKMNMEALKLCRAEEIISELKQDGFKFQFTEETYLKDIDRIQTSLKRDKIQLAKAQRQLSDMQGKGGGKKMTEDDFYNSLAELRKFENYQSEPLKLADEMSLYSYCQAMKRYNKHIQSLRKQQKHG